MRSSIDRSLGALVVIALVVCTPLRAQTVTGVRALAFGTLLPGVPDHVLRTDAVASGRFNIRGTRNAQVQLQFLLPASMAGPAGATMPLSFGATDGGFSPTQSVTNQTAFDPRAASLGRLPGNGRASVFLGGTASPAPTQRAGAYTGTITLTVSYTGL
jgi:hypothetical protein